MRDDMNKLLCEHERPGSYMNFHGVRRARNLDRDQEVNEVGGREGMKYRHHRAKGRGTKPFGENLNPLYGWIRKQVGRPWDKAYSELCQTFDMRNTINQHILVHLFERIEINTAWIDGKVCWLDSRQWSARGESPDYDARWKEISENRYAHFFVDPRTGIVRENKKRRTWKQEQQARVQAAIAERDKVFRRLDENTHLHLEDGQWYVYTIKKLPEKREFVLPPAPVGFNISPEERAQAKLWWRGLTDAEQREYGRVVLMHPPYTSVRRPKQNQDKRTEAQYHYAARHGSSGETHYYASKKPADAKLKRRLGLS